MKKIFTSLFYIFLPIAIGFITSIFIDTSNYQNLIKPMFSPSKIVFPIVWSILYVLIGISYYLYKRKNYYSVTDIIYYLQLFFNFLWSFLFFNLDFKFFSIIWLVILILLVIILFIRYLKESKISAYLIIPYILWLFIALYLNISIYILN